jgi:GTP-binding protein
VVDQVFDLFVKLNAPDDLLDFPVVYASAKEGYAKLLDLTGRIHRHEPISEMIIAHIPAPSGSTPMPPADAGQHHRLLPLSGPLGIGKVVNGTLSINKPIAVAKRDGRSSPGPDHQDLPLRVRQARCHR